MFIVIARDARVEALKKRKPHDDEEARLANVAHAFPHATVILGDESDIFAPLRTYEPHILVFGYDQRVPEDRIREFFPTTEIARIGSYEPERWKSSLIREKISK
jgi:glycerol-3-phosphate cytidylyltransferase-like family protein